MTTYLAERTAEEQIVYARHLLSKEPAYFERLVIYALMDPSWANRLMPILGVMHDQSQCQDFSQVFHESLLQALRMYYHMVGFKAGTDAMPVNFQLLGQCLMALANSGKISASLVHDVATYAYNQVFLENRNYHGNSLNLVEYGAMQWLAERRKTTVLQRAGYFNWDAAQLREYLNAEMSFINQLTRKEERMHAFGAGLNEVRLDVERFPCSIASVNERLGGGPGRGEGYLFMSASGGGKTVGATQLSAEWAMQNRKGLLITTEQQHYELEPRIISAQCHIPFGLIKDGVDPVRLTQEQREDYAVVQQKLKSNLWIYNWPRQSRENVVNSLRDVLDQFSQISGGLDFFMLDWLGAALGDGISDKDAKRMALQNSADFVVAQADARELNCVGMAFAQAHPTQGTDTKQVDASTLWECKTLHVNMTGLIGATLLLDHGTGGKRGKTQDGDLTALPEQYWYISKSRKGTVGLAPVRRDFRYQRFTPRKEGGPQES